MNFNFPVIKFHLLFMNPMIFSKCTAIIPHIIDPTDRKLKNLLNIFFISESGGGIISVESKGL